MGTTGKAILVLVVLALCCLGQQTHRRMLIAPKAPSGGIPPLPAGISRRWIATNLFDPVTNWFDIIGGLDWGQGDPNVQPRFTNGYGVYFNGGILGAGYFLTNDNTVFQLTTNTGTAGSSFFAVIRFDDLSISANYSGIIFANANVYYPFMSYQRQWQTGFNTAVAVGTNVTDVVCDFLYAGCLGTDHYFYTNGVLALVTNKGLDVGAITRVGHSSSTYGMKGAIYEFIHWTNIGCLSSAQAAAIHQYATNAHVYSP